MPSAPASGIPAAGGSRIARPASRNSMVPDSKPTAGAAPATRSRLGVQTRAKAASAIPRTSVAAGSRPPSVLGNRPPSSLGGAGNGPAPMSGVPSLIRRPSVSASQIGSAASFPPSGASTSQEKQHAARINQLETELATANETISSLQNSLAEAEIAAASASAEIQSVQRRAESEAEESLVKAEAAAEAARDELADAKEDHAAELASIRHDFEEERASLIDRVRDLEKQCSELEHERDDLAGSREDLNRLLAEAQRDLASMPALQEECEELETELAWHEEQLQKLEDERAEEKVAVKTIKRELEDADEVIAGLERENEHLRHETATLKIDKEELLAKLQSTEIRDVVAPVAADSEARLGRVQAHRDQLAAELTSVEDSHATLIVVLAAAAQAHRCADRSLVALRNSQAGDAERASAERASVEEELAAIKERHGATSAQLSSALAQLDLHARSASEAKAVEADLASARETLASRESEIVELTARISALERDLEESDATIADLHARLEQTVGSPSARPDEAGLAQQLEEAIIDRDQAEEELHSAEAHIAELEAELDAVRAAPAPATAGVPLDDSSAPHVELVALREELETLPSSHATRLQEIEDLQAQLVTERALTADAQDEAKAVEEALMDARHQIGELEAKVRSCEERVAGLEAERESSQLKLAEMADLEEALDQAEQQLVSVTFELDDLRAQHDDLAQAALQDSAERQVQSDEHDELLELYNRRALELDSLRKILAETESHADSLAWQLREKASAAGTLESAYEREREELLARITQSEQEQDHLRDELDEAKLRLSDAQDALDYHAGADESSASLDAALPDNATGSPAPRSPGNLSMSFSPSADPVALLMRLREERDELRDRLDFARQEAKHRTDDLQDRLRRMDEVKAHEVSVLQLDLMDKQAAYETEREMNDKLEQTVRELQEQRDQLGEDREASRRLLRDAESTVQDLSSQLAACQQRLDGSLAQAQDVAQLQDELSETSQAAAEAQSATASARLQFEQVQAALLEAQDERDAARHAVVEQEDFIAALEERVALLEGEAARENSSSTKAQDPLADFATLCNALPSDQQYRETRITELEATLRRYEERIALLQLNLAMRVALDDTDEDDSPREGPPDADATFVADASEEVETVRRDLAAVTREREVLLGRLQATLDELDSALRVREANTRRTLELENDLADARAVAETRSLALTTAEADIKELDTRVKMQVEKAALADANAVKLVDSLEQSERLAAASQTELRDLQTEIAHLRDDLALARAAVTQASSAEQAAREEAAVLAADLQEARTTLSAAVADQTELQALVTDLQTRSRVAGEEVTTLRRDLQRSKEDLSACEGRLDVALREHAAVLEAHAHTKRAAEEATEQHSALSRRLAELGNDFELSCRENQTLRRLGQSSVAEAEALAAEVSTLKQELEQAISAGQAELKAAHDQATRNLTEVITELEKRERGQAAAEEHARQLALELEREKAQERGSSAQDSARIAELEKTLEMRMLDVEEADEKLIEVLKTQKRSAASVERLKAKVASLQRDLTAAKALQPAPIAVPLPGAPASPAAGRKRPAPSEFDVKPAPARAIAQAPSAAFDKENAGGNSARRQEKTLKSVKPAVTEILVKDHGAGAPRRDALARVDDNATSIRSADAPTDKIAALNARLQSFRRPKSAEIV